MLSGYADENLKAAIVAGLRQRGMDLVTAEDRNQRRTDDELFLETATAEGRLLLTNDTDFLRITESGWPGGAIMRELSIGLRIVSLARPFAAFISMLSKPLPWMRQTL